VGVSRFAQTDPAPVLDNLPMGNSNRTPGFWAVAGVVYDVDQLGSFKHSRARLPGRTEIAGRGRTKPQGLADLKSAHVRAKLQTDAGWRLG
jgi:hypothetical protein